MRGLTRGVGRANGDDERAGTPTCASLGGRRGHFEGGGARILPLPCSSTNQRSCVPAAYFATMVKYAHEPSNPTKSAKVFAVGITRLGSARRRQAVSLSRSLSARRRRVTLAVSLFCVLIQNRILSARWISCQDNEHLCV
eukprot:scaffold304615_cov38-Prasinocladus_malaysianus.AAC.1